MSLIERRVPTLFAVLAMAASFGLLVGLFFIESGGDAAASPVAIQPAPMAAGAPADAGARPSPAAAPRFDIVRLRPGARAALWAAPGRDFVETIGPRTEFGSPVAFSVVSTRPGWLGVATPDLPDGQLGWIRRDPRRLAVSSTGYSLRVDLSTHRLSLRYGAKTLRSFTVSVGAPGSETPLGRYGITDAIRYHDTPYYGCCVLALSGRQTHLPAGWTGGDRLAIHGSPGPVGGAESAGCLHATEATMRLLLNRLPLGTPVFVRE